MAPFCRRLTLGQLYPGLHSNIFHQVSIKIARGLPAEDRSDCSQLSNPFFALMGATLAIYKWAGRLFSEATNWPWHRVPASPVGHSSLNVSEPVHLGQTPPEPT